MVFLANAANSASARSASGRKSNRTKECTLSATGLNVTGTPAPRARSASRCALANSASGSAAWMSSGGRPDRSARTGDTSGWSGSASWM